MVKNLESLGFTFQFQARLGNGRVTFYSPRSDSLKVDFEPLRKDVRIEWEV